jgi:hypothetical protein
MDNNWTIINDDNNIYEIVVYDDGNDIYKKYSNKWNICGRWKGKIKLVNIEKSNIKINSISEWKIVKM